MSEKNYSPSDFIPKPCKEDWHAMSGDEQRRHCKKCDTHVHDLTGKSAEEILAMHKKNGGKLCGAFRLGASVGRPLALGSGIASLALASCAKKEVVLPGIVCEPSPEEKPAGKKKSSITTFKSDHDQRISVDPAQKVDPDKPVKIDPENVPMMLGMMCPREEPAPKKDRGPI